MSLLAYLFLYDENGMQIPGDCSSSGHGGAIRVMNSSYGVRQPADSNTGSITGCRQYNLVIVHKQLDKISPYLTVAVYEGKRPQKAVIKYYETAEAGIEIEIYDINLEDVVISSVDFIHVYHPGSSSPNMHEVVSLKFRNTEWNYVKGDIRHNDTWIKSVKKEQRQ